MNLAQAFKMAVKSIWSKKRSLLTMLGIIIGIAAVMIIVSVITGANKKSMEYYESMGTNKISVSAQLYSGGDAFEEVYNYCKSIDMVVGVTPTGYVGRHREIRSQKQPEHGVSAADLSGQRSVLHVQQFPD